MKNNKGITLVALTIMIIVLLILSSVAIYNGSGTIKYIKFNKIKSQVEIMQTEVNSWYQQYNSGNTSVLDYGIDISACDQEKLQKTLTDVNISSTDKDNYRYFSADYLVNTLSIDGIDEAFLVDIKNRNIILFEGITYDGETYYTPEDFGISNVENIPISEVDFKLTDESENANQILIYELNFYDTTGEKISISKFKVEYKKQDSDNWQDITKNIQKTEYNGDNAYCFNISESGSYDVKVSSFDKQVSNEKNINAKAVSIPKGLYLVGGTVNTGLVISDNQNDENKGENYENLQGNQYVWIDVPNDGTGPDYTAVTSNTDYTNIEKALQTYAATYREGAQGQGWSWKDQWYDYYGTMYDGINEYSQILIWYSDEFTEVQTYYGKIYTDSTGTTEASTYTSGTEYYVNITDKLEETRGCGLTYQEYNIRKNKMLKSIYENGGFFIGRYEAGIEVNRTSETDEIADTLKPLSQANKYALTWVTCSQAQNLANRLSTSEYTGSLMFGIQWDLVMKYLETKGATEEELKGITTGSTNWGNYRDSIYNITNINAKYSIDDGTNWTEITSSTPYNKTEEVTLLTTGADKQFCKQNIYDLAGNVKEITLEYAWDCVNKCAVRGGSYFDYGGLSDTVARLLAIFEFPANSREPYEVNYSDYLSGFRVAFY